MVGMIERVDRKVVKDVEMHDKQNQYQRLDLQIDKVKRKVSPVRRLSLEVREKVKWRVVFRLVAMHLPQTEETVVMVVVHQIDQLDHPLPHMIRGLGLRLVHHLAYGHMVVGAVVVVVMILEMMEEDRQEILVMALPTGIRARSQEMVEMVAMMIEDMDKDKEVRHGNSAVPGRVIALMAPISLRKMAVSSRRRLLEMRSFAVC